MTSTASERRGQEDPGRVRRLNCDWPEVSGIRMRQGHPNVRASKYRRHGPAGMEVDHAFPFGD